MKRVTLSRNQTTVVTATAVRAGSLLWAGCLDVEGQADGSDGDRSALADQQMGHASRALGATIAQSAYAKSSNAEADDVFGVAVALDGDTLRRGLRVPAHGHGLGPGRLHQGRGSRTR